uniref:Uncharacterized protein n=1 Tax=Zooxanthella nutricula TaxID=1333877 RepID=A0A6U6II38_9DINO
MITPTEEEALNDVPCCLTRTHSSRVYRLIAGDSDQQGSRRCLPTIGWSWVVIAAAAVSFSAAAVFAATAAGGLVGRARSAKVEGLSQDFASVPAGDHVRSPNHTRFLVRHLRKDPESTSAPEPRDPWGVALGVFSGVVETAQLALHLVTQTSTTTTTTITATTTTFTTTTRTSTTKTTTTATTTTVTTTSTTVTTTSTSTRLCTLYCFSVMRATGYEVVLMRALAEQKVSIFACEDYDVFSQGATIRIGHVVAKGIHIKHMEKGNLSKTGTTTASWLNTQLFLEAWNLVFDDGRWWQHGWTVKVDPDAVFFPDRLKVRLYSYYPAGITDGPARFVANCDRSWNGDPYELKLFGSLEVFTRNAVGMYHAHSKQCIADLDWEGWGEDFYMQECMKKLTVPVINGVSFVGDVNCHPAACTDTTKVVYHSYKDVQAYFDCWGQSHVAPKAPVTKMVMHVQ